MKYSITEIKGLARENLLGKFPLPIGVFLLSQVIILLINSPFQRMIRNGTEQLLITPVLIALVGEIIVMLIGILFGAGLSKIHLNIARRKPASIKDFVFPFQNHPDKYMGYGMLILVICMACTFPGSVCLGVGAAINSIPLAAAGIILMIVGAVIAFILTLGFSLTSYMLLDDPYGTKVIPAMKKSWQYMKGKKGRLFLLYLSFIGLYILGILSFGLGFLWIQQYVLQSQVIFYLKVCADNMEYHNVLNGTQE